jgi:hypothetical protein
VNVGLARDAIFLSQEIQDVVPKFELRSTGAQDVLGARSLTTILARSDALHLRATAMM